MCLESDLSGLFYSQIMLKAFTAAVAANIVFLQKSYKSAFSLN